MKASGSQRCSPVRSRAVYYVDEFPTGNFDKLLKNQLREMADAQPAVD